jgi:hypothetical protein
VTESSVRQHVGESICAPGRLDKVDKTAFAEGRFSVDAYALGRSLLFRSLKKTAEPIKSEKQDPGNQSMDSPRSDQTQRATFSIPFSLPAFSKGPSGSWMSRW